MQQVDSKEPDLNGKVAGEIRAELGRKGLRQWELAVQLDWSQSMLSRRLSGLIPFSTDEIERIARVLDIPVSQLTTPHALAS